MTVSAIARRRSERAERIELAARWADTLRQRLTGLRVVVVVGSVARGDFNRWSDIDVLVVADPLPDRWLDRCDAIGSQPAGIQTIAWTFDEYSKRTERGDPIAVEASTDGVVVWGAL